MYLRTLLVAILRYLLDLHNQLGLVAFDCPDLAVNVSISLAEVLLAVLHQLWRCNGVRCFVRMK